MTAQLSKEPSFWERLGAVTFRQALMEAPFFLGLFAIGCVVGAALEFVPDVAPSFDFNEWYCGLSRHTQYVGAVAFFTLVLLGQTFQMPTTIRQWFAFNAANAALIFTMANAPRPGFVLWFAVNAIGYANRLATVGGDNLAKRETTEWREETASKGW